MEWVKGPDVDNPKFIQITASQGVVYALDASGGVWKYIPAVGSERFAFWTKFTSHRADPADKKKGRRIRKYLRKEPIDGQAETK